MKKIAQYSILFMVLFGAGCTKVNSSDLNSNVPYFQSYDVAYDMATNMTTASAYFKVRDDNGSLIELSGVDGIKINGVTPGKLYLGSLFHLYAWETPGHVDVNFALTKNARTIMNTVHTKDINNINFPSGFPASFTKLTGISFSWVGIDLTVGEYVTVEVVGSGMLDTTHHESSEKTFADHNIVFTPAELQNISQGAITIKMSRSRALILDETDSTAGGHKMVTCKDQRSVVLN